MVLRNLTFVQLEQFESTLRYIAPDETNTLSLAEFTATLASLGMDEDMDYLFDQLEQE
ncbi:hypothetical protein SCLCIDRAFT_29336 [Scleroderma citrinum Foug A]|uniref:EF-hand domain-containing protein n=1 Tax=Scleroderma citrinum Foug A TaxID=1036808 RepID=A0A0C2ZWH2_9AGAM|nr:hypothetical protein SCLCIDRAFT_29336 [Scleroderma citrinum Foug A]